MLIALLGFFVVAGAIVGGFFAVTYLPDRMAGRKLERRLREMEPQPEGPGGQEASILKRQTDGPLPAVDRFVQSTRAGSSLKRLIEQSGAKTTPSAVVLLSLMLAAIAALAAAVLVHQFWAPIAAAPIGLMAPTMWLRWQRNARMRKFEEMFPEALDLMARAIRAGHAFQTAMGMAADELKAPVGPEFKKAFDQQNFGLPLREALNQLSERVPILDVRFFVTAVLIQRDTGGNLSEILEGLAHVVRERFKIQRDIRTHSAHGRFTGYVLLGLPPALAVALTYLNPDLMNLLFHEHMGHVMLAGTIVLQTVGLFWIRQVIKIEV
jgi:tight adherence protein B